MCHSSRVLCFTMILASAVAPASAQTWAAPAVSHPPPAAGQSWTPPARVAPAAPPASRPPQQLWLPVPAGPQAVRRLPAAGQRLVVGAGRQRIVSGRDDGRPHAYARRRRGFFGNGYGDGLDTASLNVVQPLLQGAEGGSPGYLPAFAGPFAPPPRCPLVIKVGQGLLHPVRSQVIAGHPGCI